MTSDCHPLRLFYGNDIGLLTLPRNPQTSVEMIERLYSSNLTAEMNTEMLQSKRLKGKLSLNNCYLKVIKLLL